MFHESFKAVHPMCISGCVCMWEFILTRIGQDIKGFWGIILRNPANPCELTRIGRIGAGLGVGNPARILRILVKITHMKLVGRKQLARIMRRYDETELAIGRWIDMVEGAEWRDPHDVRRSRPGVDRLGGKRFLFDVMQNRYRLVVDVDYARQQVTVVFVGTHAEYTRRLKRGRVRSW